jgi:IclR family acetate operon transcriptional repressor
LFEAFADAGGPLSLTEISQRISVPISSCHSIVRTLQIRGYVYVIEERKRIYPTKRLLGIAQSNRAPDRRGALRYRRCWPDIKAEGKF